MADPIRLIAGLGNPGPQYELTRHNAGFWFADHIADWLHASFSLESRLGGSLARAQHQGQTIYLLKPLTYMNLSGQAVQAAAAYFKIKPSEILVLHDELDIPPGCVKLKKGGGHAGHNGLRDIQKRLNTPDFWRLRIGIGHPRTLKLAQPVADYVLHRPSSEHMECIEDSLRAFELALPDLLDGQTQRCTEKLAAINKQLDHGQQ